ncbi:MAG: UvrD-helicase domain-containing protein, partial [Firmicutes bacterium]|nr:UvrD-helicase domain-containing protein [Bacillota bacterium]
MANIWTKEQQEAIDSRGKDLLVSAAAGSGKTAVLVERIKKLILQDKVPVTAMLVVTFTKAAASEMREKIQKALSKELLRTDLPAEEERFLKEQLSQLHRANISTFHAFAAELLREYFPVAEVDPGFKVCDDVQSRLLQNAAMEELLRSRFEGEGAYKEDFLEFLRLYGTSKGEETVKSMILQIHRFVESLPDPEAWLAEAAAFPGKSLEEFRATRQFQWMQRDIGRYLRRAQKAANDLEKDLMERYPLNLGLKAASDAKQVRKICAAFEKSFDEGRELCLAASFEQFRAKKEEKEQYAVEKKSIERRRAYYKEGLKDLAALYLRDDLAGALEWIRGTQKPAETLCALAAEFGDLYRQQKERKNLLDFSDLEHCALRILREEEARKTLQGRFRHIFVDEYQDSNLVQEELIARLKAEDNNLFLVGDVKQSIYRFRLAEPGIFLARGERYGKKEEEGGQESEKRLDLNRNFRSEGGILDSVNRLFRGLMEREISGMDYDDAAALYPGTADAAARRTPVELHLVDPRKTEAPAGAAGADGAPESPEGAPAGAPANSEGAPKGAAHSEPAAPEAELKRAEAEAALAAELIAKAIGKPFYDKNSGAERPLQYRDVVILLRAGTGSTAYEQALLDRGIPAYTNVGEGYFDTLEIGVFLDLLRVIDNRRQDKPLISTLHSAIFRFTADELAAIRLERREGSFAEAFLFCAEEGSREDLREKCRKAAALLEHFRNRSRFLPLEDFLWELMEGTGYYHYAGALPGGSIRQANLRALTEKATAYEASDGKGLFGWIRFVEAMQAGKISVPQVKMAGENDDVVRIMTIHKS